MSHVRENIDSDLQKWIEEQKIFFVGTSPLSPSGHVNISPKGGDAFKILGPLEVVYQDYTGSGAETVAHLKENGRIIVMFCDFVGSPKIVRLHGIGEVVERSHPRFKEFERLFPINAGTRAFIRIEVNRVSDSCGLSVPYFDFRANRDGLDNWSSKQAPDKLEAYREKKNVISIDGLPAFTPNSK